MTNKTNKCQCSCDECGAECEPLNPLDNGVYDLKSQLQAKEQECEGLKEELKMNQKFVDDNHIESTEFCKKFERYKRALDEIETFLQDALDTEKTDTQESFDNFYKCLDIIAKAKEQ